MPLDFPNSPSVNDTYSGAGTTWRWDGTAWNVVPTENAYLSVAGTQSMSNKSLGTDLNANSNTVTNLKAPVSNGDAATKAYVDTATAVPVYIDGGQADTDSFDDSITGGAA